MKKKATRVTTFRDTHGKIISPERGNPFAVVSPSNITIREKSKSNNKADIENTNYLRDRE
jgi:hypothetical protein